MEPNEKKLNENDYRTAAKETLFPQPTEEPTDAHSLLFNAKTPQHKKSVSIFEALEARRLQDIAEVEKQIQANQAKPETQEPQQPLITQDAITRTTEELALKNKIKTQQAFRLKLVTIVFAIIAGLCAVWITYSSITLDKTNYLIAQHTTQTELLQQENNNNNENNSVITNNETLDKKTLTEHPTTETHTSFFDKICNFFSGIFGG